MLLTIDLTNSMLKLISGGYHSLQEDKLYYSIYSITAWIIWFIVDQTTFTSTVLHKYFSNLFARNQICQHNDREESVNTIYLLPPDEHFIVIANQECNSIKYATFQNLEFVPVQFCILLSIIFCNSQTTNQYKSCSNLKFLLFGWGICF